MSLRCRVWLHAWSRWRPYIWRGERNIVVGGTGAQRIGCYEVRQVRRCADCGRTQDRLVMKGGWPNGIVERELTEADVP